MKIICRLFAILFLLFNASLLSAQQEMIDTNAFQMIRHAEMNSSQIPDIAHYLTDVSGARLTNSPGFFRAGKWAVEIMKKWGLVNARLEPWGEYGRGWEIENFQISLKKPYNGYVIGYALPWSTNTNGEIQAPIYEVLNTDLMDSTYMQKHKNDFRGKIILLTRANTKHDEDFKPFSTRYTDSELVKMPNLYMVGRSELETYLKSAKILEHAKLLLKANGALAIVDCARRGRDGTVGVQNSGGYKMNSPVLLPEAVISSEDGFKMRRLLASGHPVGLALNIRGKFYSDDTKGYNVVAEIPGTDPALKSQIVMIGGHLDSWNGATGATDNAAGCIVMMEAVRLLDSLKLKPKRTIRIALWSGEEQGVYGSYNYVKNHFGNGETGLIKPDQKNMSVYFNLDGGSGRIRGIFAQGDTAIKPIFEQWFAACNDPVAKTVSMSSTGSTDHLSFDWAGIPAFQFIQDPLDYESKTHHTNMDTYDYLQMDDLKASAIIIASFIYQAANRPDMLPRKPMVNGKFPFEGF